MCIYLDPLFTMAENFYSGVTPITKDNISTVQFDARFPNCNQV